MASLVDYEDSDSETNEDCRTEPHDTGLHLDVNHDQHTEDKLFIMNPSSQSCVSGTHDSRSFKSSCIKRSHPNPTVVRPYVSKRQRVSTTSAQIQTEAAHAAGSHPLSEVSETIRPYLSRRQAGTQLPKQVQCGLEGHQGPVNTLQWCPVDHHSHLLLSASMDKTFKVPHHLMFIRHTHTHTHVLLFYTLFSTRLHSVREFIKTNKSETDTEKINHDTFVLDRVFQMN